MVLAIRRGSCLRGVARRFGVSPMTVGRWCKRAKGKRLDRMDWTDRPAGCHRPHNRTGRAMERKILSTRQQLKTRSALGEHGAGAIHAALLGEGLKGLPSIRTIGRILSRNGLLDGRKRVRRPPPPKGWYLPDVAATHTEIDSFDTITDLVIQGGKPVTVLNAMSLHGGLPGSWPQSKITAKIVVQSLLEHWTRHGRPHYAKFDNDTIFQGAHQWPDSFGRVIRLCLQLGVTPIFAPPREPGFQAEVEAFNGRWQRLVWQRFKHRSVGGLQIKSHAMIDAMSQRSSQRIAGAPPRRPMPGRFKLNLNAPLNGVVIFLRRTNGQGRIECLGHQWTLDANWPHRLVRIEVDLSAGRIRFFKLRRREPTWQPLVKTIRYRVPTRRFKGQE